MKLDMSHKMKSNVYTECTTHGIRPVDRASTHADEGVVRHSKGSEPTKAKAVPTKEID
jgi:hypothetical protein